MQNQTSIDNATALPQVTQPRIRPLAICLFRRGDKLLVAEGYDLAKTEYFFRPVGGGIEFGELGTDTIAREVMEELGAEVRDVRYLFTVENIYVFDNAPGHEIVLVYDGEFVDEALYDREVVRGVEAETPFDGIWMSVDALRNDARPLYPSGILDKLSTL